MGWGPSLTLGLPTQPYCSGSECSVAMASESRGAARGAGRIPSKSPPAVSLLLGPRQARPDPETGASGDGVEHGDQGGDRGFCGTPRYDSHSSFPSTAILAHGRAKSSSLCPWSSEGSCSEGQHTGEGPRALPSSPDPSEALGLGEAGGGAMAGS